MDDRDETPLTDPQLGRALESLAGGAPPQLDLDAVRARASRRRAMRRVGVVGVAAAVAVAGLAVGHSVADIGGEDEGQTVVVSPGPDQTDEERDSIADELRRSEELRARERARQEEERRLAELQRERAESGAEASCVMASVGMPTTSERELAAATATVEELLAARMRGEGVERCATPEAVELLGSPGVDLLTNMRPLGFPSPYAPEEDARRATRPIPVCVRFADFDDPVVDHAVLEVRPGGRLPLVAEVDVGYTTASGRVTGQTYRVSWVREGGGTGLVRQLLVDSVGSDLLRFGGAERVVVDYMAALASGRYDQAAFWFAGAGGSPLAPGEPSHNAYLVGLERAEPELVAAGDLDGLLSAFCERHGGPCAPVLDIVGVEQHDASSRVTFRLDDGSGRPLDRAGITVFALQVVVFEGQVGTASVPVPFA